MATNEDVARLFVRIEATQKQFEKQMAAIAKKSSETAGGIEKDFKRANDNMAKGGAANVKSLNAQRAAAQTLSFQLNDVATSLAGGASAFQVAAQQGGQFVQAINQAGGGAAGIKAVGTAIAGLINPTTAITIGLIYLAGKTYEYFTSAEDGSKEADKALKEHQAMIASVAKEWGDAVPWVKEYAEAIESAKSAADLQEVTRLRIDEIFANAKGEVKDLSVNLADVTSQLRAAGAEEDSIIRIEDAFNKLKNAIDNNRDSSKETTELTRELIDAWLNTGVSGAQSFASSIHGIADAFADYAKRAKEASDAAEEAIRNQRVLDAQKNLPGNLGQLTPLYSGGGRFMNEAEAQNSRAEATKSQTQTEAERSAEAATRSVKKVTDSFDSLDGVINKYVNDVVKAESGGKANAKNPLSSATGLGQFIESTWLTLFKENFPDRAKGMSDATILALRTDADISRNLIEAYARENAELLRAAGVSVNEAALHLAHFLGPGGAISVLKAPAGTPVAGLLSPGAISANPSILGGGATTDDVIAYANKRASAYDTMTASTKQAAQAQKELNTQAQEFSSFGQNLVSGFIQDLRNGASAADALKNALSKVLDQVIEIGLQNLFGGAAGGGGGLLGGLFSIFGAANGGVYSHGKPMKTFAKGGVSRSAAIFGEAGPEAAVPLPDGRSIPVSFKSPASSRGATNETVNIILQDDSGRMADIADQRIQTKSGTIVNVAVNRANASAPASVAKYQAMKAGGDYRNVL